MRLALLLPLLAACADPVLGPTDRDPSDPDPSAWAPDAGAASESALGDPFEATRPSGLDLTYQTDALGGRNLAPAGAVDDTATVQTTLPGAATEPTCTRGTAREDDVRRVIRDTFGRHGDAALRVAWCESGPWGTSARNGQYRGLFQMGRYERATYGHGPCAEAQAHAAHRYFVASGRDWSPWACRP